MKKISGLVVLGTFCIMASLSASGAWNTKSFNTFGAKDSTRLSFPADSTTTQGVNVIKTADGSRIIGSVSGWRDMVASFILSASTETDLGFGVIDTAILVLVTTMEGRENRTLGTANCGSLPCTLFVAVDLDTLMYRSITLEWDVFDSVGAQDNVVGATYPITTFVLKRD